jgi:hypothetical protein
MGAGSSAFQLVLLEGCVVVGWYGKVTDEGIKAWREAIDEVARDAGGPIGLVACVRESSPPPDGEVRRTVAKLIFDDAIAVSLLVFEGTGFRAAVVRSVLIMMFAMGGNKNTAHKVTGDPREATQWFHKQSAGQPWRPDSGTLRQVIDAMLSAN